MEFEFSPRAEGLREKLLAFMDEHIYPNESTFAEQIREAGDPHAHPPILEELKAKAREQGLWNLFLPHKTEWTPEPLSNLDYAPLAEIMGRVGWASEVFNCSAPDTGNMEILSLFGTREQQEKWLVPLLDGEIRSCFGMTEPDVASSDARNIQSSIVRDGDSYVINGRKWWTSGALRERTKVMIFMGKTDPEADTYTQQSMILVPMDSPGLTVERDLNVFGYTDHPGHAEISFDDVRVPASNLLGDEGSGFAIAQERLGPGRIHHCMRTIGVAERALELMCDRVTKRSPFGRPLSEQGVIREWIADSRIEIEQARLLTLKTAWLMDTVGNKGARIEVAAIKVAVPNMALRIVDRAIQAHGGMGVCQDTPLPRMYASLRTLRLADGPDEVHRRSVARQELKKYTAG